MWLRRNPSFLLEKRIVPGRVDQTLRFRQDGVENLKVFVFKHDVLEVFNDAGLADGLGNDRSAALHAPREDDLGRSLVVLLGNGQDLFILEQRRVGAAERRVGSDF